VKPRSHLFRKYAVLFVALVSGALLVSGLLELYFSYRENEAALVLLQRDDQRPDRGLVNLDHLLALAADQVHVPGLLGQVIAGRAVVDVGVLDQAKLLEQLECAVDSRDVHAAGGLPDFDADLLGRGVLEPGHGFQDELALRGDTVSTGPQRVIPRVHHDQSLVRGRSSGALPKRCCLPGQS